MIIPTPSRSSPRPGSYALGPDTPLHVADPALTPVARVLREQLLPGTGCTLPPGRGGIELALAGDLAADPGAGPEAYRLTIGPDGIRIAAGGPAGAFYGVQTLRQLLPPHTLRHSALDEGPWDLSCVEIEDRPRFAWRGVLLDVARHFFTKRDVLRVLDQMALHKLNVLHFHLTDDQGWRLEVKRYPRLTEVGSWRTESKPGWNETGDGRPHGGYYTQDDIREIVAYAAARHILVVPEVDVPGHTQAAITAYPELGNTGAQLAVETGWGVKSNILNVSDATLDFVRNVFDEVIELFPSPIICVGGDECPKDQWKASPAAQARMAELGLRNEDELQSWFIRQVSDHLQARGRQLLGWDEILEGGLPPAATIVSWRDNHGAVRAAREGHQVVTSPARQVYLDYRASDSPDEPVPVGTVLPVEEVYAFEPVPEELRGTPAADLVIGAQCGLWTEAIDNARALDYQAFPRMSAFAETVWCDATRDGTAFAERLAHHLDRLEALGVEYRRPEGPRPWERRPGVRGRPVTMAEYLAEVEADTRNIR
ncbi:beta-N-acetylhexosaminidase [Streptomyces sp. WAC 06738]|uniref:beta-N-acetylhexosaminidase n=1 Tax=Streptomyces sp. WAC 06738 TaxID=2203210 RepID=UPI000F70CFD7|nr:beta-N-acetylhexosaminidase [Streptomyces sp. WAC 06738]AZM46312.1 beta-N-acetylhexosaminidase [Streptomyces sp. WAC 06738]